MDTNLINLSNTGKFNLTLAPQSVVLLTIPSGKLTMNSIVAIAATSVKGGENSNSNFGAAKQMEVQLDASEPSNNQVAYVHFDLTKQNPVAIKRTVLAINGHVDSGDKPYRLHVYGIPQKKTFDQNKMNWNTALLLDSKEALIKNVGSAAFVAGEIAFDKKDKYHYLDVTDLIKKHADDGITFALVRETRQLGDDEDKGRKVILPKSTLAPKLQIWQ